MAEEIFGPYSLISLIGRGGMGEVWRARDTRKDRIVALKRLSPWWGDDPDFARRFRREAALSAKLSSPYIVPIHDYGEIDGHLFIDMALISGTDLGELLEQHGPLPPQRALGIIGQVAKALTVAHRSGTVHRDIKPSNILVNTVDADDHVYLIDFGISHAGDVSRISRSGSVVGTPAYMAPERFSGDGDHRTDIYALGCVLHETLTGRQPFDSTNIYAVMNAHQQAPPPRPSLVLPGIPPAMDDVIAHALAKDPEQRTPSAAALAEAARLALGTTPAHGPIVVEPAPAPPLPVADPAARATVDLRPPVRRKWHPVRWIAAATAVVVIIAFSIYLAQQPKVVSSTKIQFSDTVNDVAFSGDGNQAFVATNAGIGVVDTATSQILRSIPLPHATSIALSPDRPEAYVTTAGAVAVIDTSSLQEKARISTPQVAVGIAVAPHDPKAFVLMQDFTRRYSLTAIDTRTNTVDPDPIPMSDRSGLDVRSPRFSPGGRYVYVRNPEGLTVVDAATEALAYKIDSFDVTTVAMDEGNRAFLARGSTVEIYGSNAQKLRPISLTPLPNLAGRPAAVDDMHASTDGRNIRVLLNGRTVSMVDATRSHAVEEFTIDGEERDHLRVSPNGMFTYLIGGASASTVTVVVTSAYR
ncbi:serine/threonine-protein kinase [Pseudonocardia sp. TRM90224]|uniref:serine/threonine-protein kinase n=1 Tax=Pseudonocardia sp. TRM90224 TaxID=2812678 RepID=UPI001E2FF45E|nr:serine/threonine-protein kinase [Pseudonocardia sp. TRM90224]